MKKLVRDLLLEDDFQNLSAVCDAAEVIKGQLGADAREWVLRKLPMLTEANGSLLDSANRLYLNRELSSYDAGCVTTILEAYAKVGTKNELRIVEQLANGKFIAATNFEVREAAQTCLAQIQVRLAGQKAGTELLRPSAPSENPATLLRPSRNVKSEEETVLLRSGDKFE